MVVRLHPGQERKLSEAEDKDEDTAEKGEEDDDIIDDGKELEIEIARSEEQEEVGLVEEAKNENVSDDETVWIKTVGDSQSVAGIEDDREEGFSEETPETEGILEDTDGGLEDTADTEENDKVEEIESEFDEENGEDVTGDFFNFCLFVYLFARLFGSFKMEMRWFAVQSLPKTCFQLHSSHNAYARPICNASCVHKNTPVVLWRWIFLHARPLSVPLTF